MDNLRTAFFMNRMVAVVERMGEKANKDEFDANCENCSQSKVEAVCEQCQGCICADCVVSHSKMKVFSSHKVTMFNEMKIRSSKPPATLEVNSKACSVHSQPKVVYCYDCKVLICRNCTFVEHAGHHYNFTAKGAPEAKERLKRHLVPLRGCIASISDAVKCVGDTKARANRQGASVDAAIKQHCSQLRQIIDGHEKELLETSSALEQKNIEALSAQEKIFTSASTMAQDLVEFVEQTLQHGTDDYLMEISDRVLKQIDDEVEKQKMMDMKPAAISSVQVYTASQENLIQKNIAVFLPPSGAGLEGAVVGKPSLIHVCTADEKPAEVQASLKSLYDESVLSFTGERKRCGKYEIVYTPKIRGRHELSITVNCIPIYNKPLLVRILPTQLSKPVKIVSNIRKAWGVTINSREEILVSEFAGRIHTLNKSGKNLQTLEKSGHGLQSSCGVAVDSEGSVYVANGDHHCISKMSKDGQLLTVVGRKGSGQGELNSPRGLSIIENQLYVCDAGNHRIQVFSTQLKFVRMFGRRGESIGQFDQPQVVAADENGLLYISEWSRHNNRVQVFTRQGRFIRCISGLVGGHYLGKLCGLCIVGRYLYVVDNTKDVVVVVDKDSGEFVSLFGKGYLRGPCSVAVDTDGFVYVCTFNGCNLIVF